jgi:hypothetical protein
MNTATGLRAGAVVGVALWLGVFGGVGTASQKATPAEIATKMTGTWTINRELSPSFTAPGGPGGRRGGGGPSFALAGGFQGRGGGGRGGGGGGDTGPTGPGDLTPEELAGQAAIRQLQQIAPQITIKASADSISFADGRGEQTYAHRRQVDEARSRRREDQRQDQVGQAGTAAGFLEHEDQPGSHVGARRQRPPADEGASREHDPEHGRSEGCLRSSVGDRGPAEAGRHDCT